MEFGRRLAVERELERGALEGVLSGLGSGGGGVGTVAWDEGGCFVIYPTLLGIKSESFTSFVDVGSMLIYAAM